MQDWYNELSRDLILSQFFQAEATAWLSASLPGLTRLSPADAAFFRKIFQEEELCYANSWLYLLRSTRDDQGGFGYKFVSGDMVAGVGYRDRSFSIVHPVGPNRYTGLVDLCRRIHELSQRPVVLKKVDQELYDRLVAEPQFFIERDDRDLFEEEAFPEHILQLERLFVPTPESKQRLQPFVKKVQRFERQNKLWAVKGVSWQELESNPGFERLFGYNPDKFKSYAHILKEASSAPADEGRYRVCAYYDEHGTIQGVYVSELFEPGIMGLYCAVSSKSSPGITEWMDYDFFQRLFHEGIHMLYLGGSETEGVHAYVQKLLPIVPSYLMRPLRVRHRGNKFH